jgi:hypothetical protein
VRYYKNLIKQYVYVAAQLAALKAPLASAFTLSSFLIAASMVATRQNRLPSARTNTARAQEKEEEEEEEDLALMPMWDMCNHASTGPLTSYYNAATAQLEAAAPRAFAADEQVYIYYGARTSADFVVYAGFLPEPPPDDAVKMRFAMATTGELAQARLALLRAYGLPPYAHHAIWRSADPAASTTR